MAKYIAWIPCISGELFFSKIQYGLGSYDLYIRREHSRDHHTSEFRERRIIATSVVDWQDSKFKSEPLSGLFRVVVTGRATNFNSLSGKVYLIEKNNLDSASSLTRVRPRKDDESEADFISLMKEKTSDKVSRLPASDMIDIDGVETSLNNINTTVVHCVTYKIDSTGLVILEWVNTNKAGSPINLLDSVQRILCRQSFYYLKYLLHRHTHHDHHNESLTTVHRLKSDCAANTRALTRDLKRGLVDIKRRTRKATPHSESGICEYAKSLLMSCYQSEFLSTKKTETSEVQKRNTEDDKLELERQLHYFDNISKSLSLSSDTTHSTEGVSLQREFFSLFRKSSIWLSALVTPGFFFLTRQVPVNSKQTNLKVPNIDYCKGSLDGWLNSAYCQFTVLFNATQGSVSMLVGVMFIILLISFCLAFYLLPWDRVSIAERFVHKIRSILIDRNLMNTGVWKVCVIVMMWARRLYFYLFRADDKLLIFSVFTVVFGGSCYIGYDIFEKVRILLKTGI